MRKLVKNRLGLSLVEVMIALGISGVVGVVSSVPVLDFQKKVQKTLSTQALVTAESDIYYYLSNSNVCLSTLAGVNTTTTSNITALRRQIPASAGGGFDNILVVGQPIHSLIPHLITFQITTDPIVATGPLEGMLRVNFDFRSATVPQLNKVRSFVVKVVTDSAGAVVGCTRGTTQDVASFCRAFDAILNTSGRCENMRIIGNSNVVNNLVVGGNFAGGSLSAVSANIAGNIATQELNVTSNMTISGATLGANLINVNGSLNAMNLVSTNLVCASGVYCRSFAPVNCGAGSYISNIHPGGTVGCVSRPW